LVTDYIPVFDLATEAFADARDPGSIYFKANMTFLWDRRLKQLKAAGVNTFSSHGAMLRNGPNAQALAALGNDVTGDRFTNTLLGLHSIGGVNMSTEDASHAKTVYFYAICCLALIGFVLLYTSTYCHRGKTPTHAMHGIHDGRDVYAAPGTPHGSDTWQTHPRVRSNSLTNSNHPTSRVHPHGGLNGAGAHVDRSDSDKIV
jgi:hypothetical protein